MAVELGGEELMDTHKLQLRRLYEIKFTANDCECPHASSPRFYLGDSNGHRRAGFFGDVRSRDLM